MRGRTEERTGWWRKTQAEEKSPGREAGHRVGTEVTEKRSDEEMLERKPKADTTVNVYLSPVRSTTLSEAS